MIRIITVYFISFSSVFIAGNLNRIQRAISKGDFERASELTESYLEKDPNHSGLNYYKSYIFSIPQYEKYNLDSSRVYVNKAIKYYDSLNQDLVEELEDQNLSYEVYLDFKDSIMSEQYAILLSEVSIEKIEIFRSQYPASRLETELIFKRDSIAFDETVNQNTINGYEGFMKNYSNSVFLPKAFKKLDSLKYLKLKKEDRLTAYYRFLKENTKTNYAFPIENRILELSTKDNSINSYRKFIRFSKQNTLKAKAADILYFLNPKSFQATLHPKEDSLKKIIATNKMRLFPVLENGKIGFRESEKGQLKLTPKYDSLGEENKCSLIESDWMLLKKGSENVIVNKKGDKIIEGVKEYKELGLGVSLVTKKNSRFLYHKSGFLISENSCKKAGLVGKSWIKTKSKNKYQLISFLGVPITKQQYQRIENNHQVWIFKRNDKYGLTLEQKMIQDENWEKSLKFLYDQVEFVDSTKIIGIKGNQECVLDSNLNPIIPLASHKVYPKNNHWYVQTNTGYRLFDVEKKVFAPKEYKKLLSNDTWWAFQEEKWSLKNKQTTNVDYIDLDSVKLIGNCFAVIWTSKEKHLVFKNGESKKMHSKTEINESHNSIITTLYKNKTIYDSIGNRLFSGKYESIKSISDTLFVVKKLSKYGLIDHKGKVILPTIYQLISSQNDLLFALKNGKITSIDLKGNIKIKGEYEAKPVRLKQYYVLKKNGKYGLVDARNEQIIPFKYDEIQEWNIGEFLVKKDEKYSVINDLEEVMFDEIESIKKISANGNETFWRFSKHGKFGLLSNQKGQLLDPEFTEIASFSEDEKRPFFFADQHLHLAQYHVVSYVNRNGKIVFSKAYRKEDFEKIVCDD